MIIDCHFHLEERLLIIPDLVRKMDEAGIDRVALMGALNDPFPEPITAGVKISQFLLKRKALRWMGRRLTASFDADGNIHLPTGQTIIIYPDPDNGPVFRAVEANPKKFLGWIFVNPHGKKDQKQQVLRWIDHPRCVGIKAHSFWHRYDPVKLAPLAEIAAQKGKPLLIHAGFNGNGDFLPLTKKVPGLKLILAHAGFPEFADTWKAVRGMKNVYVDLSQTSYISRRTIRETVDFLGPERCLFGTDGPFGFHGRDGLFDMTVIKTWIETVFRDTGIRRRILGENFAEIAGIW